MKKLCALLFLLLLSTFSALAANPVPAISQPLGPTSVPPASANFTLTVHGTGFVAGSVVNWNGSPRATNFVSASELTATVNSSDVASAGTNYITVTSPAPGGGTSSATPFTVRVPSSGLTFKKEKFTIGGKGVASVAVGDFNGDGKPDIATLATYQKSVVVSVSISNGDGTLQPAQMYSLGLGLSSHKQVKLVAADLNGDGNLDLVVADGPVWVMMGNGNGTFQSATQYLASCVCDGVVVTDVDSDGILDLVLGSQTKSGMNPVLLGNGDGSFHNGLSYAGGTKVMDMVGADFNGDGILDVAVLPDPLLNQVCVHFGNGNGTFTSGPCTLISTSSYIPRAIFAADFNGDGKADLAVTPNYLFLGNGDGTFQPRAISGNFQAESFNAADMNGDNKLDLIFTTGQVLVGLEFVLGNGDGTFQPPIALPSSAGDLSTGVADLNGDGKLDVIVGKSFGPLQIQQ